MLAKPLNNIQTGDVVKVTSVPPVLSVHTYEGWGLSVAGDTRPIKNLGRIGIVTEDFKDTAVDDMKKVCFGEPDDYLCFYNKELTVIPVESAYWFENRYVSIIEKPFLDGEEGVVVRAEYLWRNRYSAFSYRFGQDVTTR